MTRIGRVGYDCAEHEPAAVSATAAAAKASAKFRRAIIAPPRRSTRLLFEKAISDRRRAGQPFVRRE
jgi:hypothetical protein